jgi:LmbE family N-acetylglucosaminyl deacetylase
MLTPSRVLVLAPHTDDGEFGGGATLAKWAAAGAEIHYVAFSTCEQSVPEGFSPDVLVHEVKAATKILGIRPEHLTILNYQVRTFAEHRQAILEDMIKIRQRVQPEVVMMPARQDFHQDHATIAQEGLRAFKHATLLGYELPWNNTSFSTGAFSVVSEAHLQKKIEALAQYQSQAFRNYASENFIRSLATVRGVQAGAAYAEAFDVVRIFV